MEAAPQMTETERGDLLAGNWLSWTPDALLPSGWNRHIPLFAWLFERLNPRLSVELGVRNGASFRPLCQLIDRFSDRGAFIGIDTWPGGPSGPWEGDSQYQGLTDFCATHYPDVASLLRLDLAEAVREFEDESVDFLHIAASGTAGGTPFDPTTWAAKLRPGGVIVFICSDEPKLDDDTDKAWRQISEFYPSASIGVPGFTGIAQHPSEGQAPILQALQADPRAASALFRLLGERMEFRHALSSEPLTAAGLRKYLADLLSDHAGDIRRLEAQHEVARQALDQQLASTYDRLLDRSLELGRIQNEADYLMAKLADLSARNERRIASLETSHAAEVELLKDNLVLQAQSYDALQSHLVEQEAHINALQRTVSWRLTRPLRVVQGVRLKIRRRLG